MTVRVRRAKSVDERRAAFSDAVRELAAAKNERASQLDGSHPLHAEFDAALVSAAKAVGCKRPIGKDGRLDRKAVERALTPEGFERVRAPFQARADELSRSAEARVKAAEERSNALAAPDLLRRGETRLVFHESWRSSYSSQGWSAEKYAKEKAEMMADVARFYGVDVEVKREVVGGEGAGTVARLRNSDPLSRFDVVVSVEGPDDVELLRRLPGEPFAETVRKCWERGVNPRVYFYWIPHGYEEANGFDFHGRKAR